MFHFERVVSIHTALSPYKFITFIGAGGKTSLIESSASGFMACGQNPVITTTTKIYAKPPYVLESSLTEDLLKSRPFFRIGSNLTDGKLQGVSSKTLSLLGKFYDVILIEGDGAKGKPLKYPMDYEPVIPDSTDLVVLVCGADGLNQRVKDVVFRWDVFCKMEGLEPDRIVDEEMFVGLVCGPMLNKAKGKRYSICLNKYDAVTEKKVLTELIRKIAKRTEPEFLLLSSAKYGIFYMARTF